jgi:hypothetical protein
MPKCRGGCQVRNPSIPVHLWVDVIPPGDAGIGSAPGSLLFILANGPKWIVANELVAGG